MAAGTKAFGLLAGPPSGFLPIVKDGVRIAASWGIAPAARATVTKLSQALRDMLSR
jgi:hypothetical protein